MMQSRIILESGFTVGRTLFHLNHGLQMTGQCSSKGWSQGARGQIFSTCDGLTPITHQIPFARGCLPLLQVSFQLHSKLQSEPMFISPCFRSLLEKNLGRLAGEKLVAKKFWLW